MPSGQPFNSFYTLFLTADPDLNQDLASLRCCLYKWSLHYSLPTDFDFPVLIDEPRISLPETFGACMNTPLKINVTMAEGNPRYPSPWNVNWYQVRTRKNKRQRTIKVTNSATLTVDNPLPKQTGELYEVDVRNPFGLARGMTRIVVTEGIVSFVNQEISSTFRIILFRTAYSN